MLKIIKAQITKNYEMLFLFNNGKKIKFDCSELFKYQMFEPLKDESLFRQYALNENTIYWSNGADIAPEYILDHGKELNKK